MIYLPAGTGLKKELNGMTIISFFKLKRVILYLVTAMLLVVSVMCFIGARPKLACSKLIDSSSSAEVERYFFSWFDGISRSGYPFESLQGMASVDSAVSPNSFELLNLNVERLGLPKQGASVSFNREVENWDKEFHVGDVRSVTVKSGRSKIIFLVNNSVSFGQLEWRVKNDMIQKVSDRIFVVCEEN